jgi:hypothetical protein
VPLREARDALIVRDQGAGKLDRRGNEQPIGRIAMFEMV